MMAAHQPNFLPFLGFVDKALRTDVFVLLDGVQYTKNSFINRNRIRVPGGDQWLTVPVKRMPHRCRIDEVAVSGQEWRIRLWKTVAQNYRRSAMWSRYYPDVERLFMEYDDDMLIDINIRWLAWLLKEFGSSCMLVLQSSYGESGLRGSEMLADLCVKTGCSRYLSGSGAKSYMVEDAFTDRGVEVEYQDFKHPVYRQVYSPFIPNMSSLDALFNVGGNIGLVIR
jgi:hypothetical protein